MLVCKEHDKFQRALFEELLHRQIQVQHYLSVQFLEEGSLLYSKFKVVALNNQ